MLAFMKLPKGDVKEEEDVEVEKLCWSFLVDVVDVFNEGVEVWSEVVLGEEELW